MTGPIAAYNFDEASGDAIDYSGNGFDFSLGAFGTRVAGHNGTAASKSGGSGGLVPLPAGLLALVNASTSRTLMAWIKGSGATWYVRCQHNDISSGGWGFLNLTGTAIGPRARNASGLAQFQMAIPGGGSTEYHLAASYDETDGTLRTFLNGSLVDSRTLTPPLRDDADTLDIMEWGTNTTWLDELMFFDYAITDEAEITQWMNTPPAEATSNDGTLDVTLPELDVSLTGDIVNPGSFGIVLSELEVALTGDVVNPGTANIAMPELVVDLQGDAVNPGAFAIDLPELNVDLAGDVINEGVLIVDLPPLVVQLTSADINEGSVNVTLPPLLMFGTREVRAMRELDSQRRTTRQFIEASPVHLALTPAEVTRTASGATTVAPGVPRPVQMFRLIPMSSTERPDRNSSGADQGVQSKYDFTLLGEYGAIVNKGDWWEDEDGQRWVIDSVVPGHGYEMKAMVTSYGGDPNG